MSVYDDGERTSSVRKCKMKISTKQFQSYAKRYRGYCLECNKFTRSETEPDADQYDCPKCFKNAVVGAENALIMGFLTIT